MVVSPQNEDLVNSCDLPTDREPPTSRDLGSLFVPPGRRHGISIRARRGEASHEELVHHLLGAYASDTLTGALTQAHIFAELVAEGCADKRHIGTLANHLVCVLEVCVGLAEQLDLDGGAR